MLPKHKLLLAGVLCAAFLLRSAGLRTGLPSETGRLATFHPDESITYYSLERMKPGELDFYPGDSLYWGTFLVYTQGAVAKAMQLTGLLKLGGRAYIMSHLGEADKLYMSGRLISSVFGTLTVLVLFFIARRMLGERAGLFAAAFFSVFYINAWMGSIVKPDGIMLFWGMLAFYCALKALEGGRLRDYLMAGAFVGLSAVSKYTGVVFALPVLLTWAMSAGDAKKAVRTLPLLLASGAAAAAVYLAVNPYLLLRTADVLPYLKEVTGKGSWPASPLSGYAEYLLYILPISVGWPVFLFSLAGFFLLAARRSREAVIMLVFSAAYFIKFGAPLEQAVSYCLPLTPFMALAAGALADYVFNKPWGKAVCLAVGVYTFAYAVYLQSFFVRPSVITEAGEWIAASVPAGAVIAISKNDTWIPPLIRRYDTPYEILSGGAPQDALSDSIAGLRSVSARAEYLILSEVEYSHAERDRAAGRPGTALELERLQSEFGEIKRFHRPISGFFLPLYRSRDALHVRFSQLTTRIFRKK